jgi:peptidoglycan hydrolase-like protein with peptidoglycan-binding domain
VPLKAAQNLVSYRNCLIGAGYTAKNNATLVLQEAIKYCYWENPGPLDGVFGVNTQYALRKVQAYYAGTNPDGIYGPITHNAMLFWSGQGTDYKPSQPQYWCAHDYVTY